MIIILPVCSCIIINCLQSLTHVLYGANVTLFIYFIFFLDEEEVAEFGTYVTAGDDDDEGGKSLLRVYEIERNNALSNF